MYEQFWEWDVLCVNDKVDSDYDELGIFFFAIGVSSVHHAIKKQKLF